MVDFSREIKAIRKALGLNQAEFADAIEASQGSVSKWERGRENPRTEVWLRIKSLYEVHEGHRTASVFEPNPIDGQPWRETAPAAVVSMLGRHTNADVAGGSFDPLMSLVVPRLPDLEGDILCWIEPVIGWAAPSDIRPGTIVFASTVDIDWRPEPGERVIVQRRDADRGFLYSLSYYGRSERGLEWFTPEPVDEERVPLSATTPILAREENGLWIVAKLFAFLQYETPSRALLERMTKDTVF